ncbi:MAG: response regulator [Sulfitobacter sp.]
MSSAAEVLDPNIGATTKPIRTLLVDDSSFDRARIKRMTISSNLSMGLSEVCNIAQMKNILSQRSFDLILIDFHLPEGNGLDVLSEVQKNALNRDAVMIMITGGGDTQTAVAAMRNGCHDFLCKETMTAAELQSSVVAAMRTVQARRDLAAQAAHQNDAIKQGLITALMDRDVQGTVASLFQSQIQPTSSTNLRAVQNTDGWDFLAQDDGDSDEFIFK